MTKGLFFLLIISSIFANIPLIGRTEYKYLPFLIAFSFFFLFFTSNLIKKRIPLYSTRGFITLWSIYSCIVIFSAVLNSNFDVMNAVVYGFGIPLNIFFVLMFFSYQWEKSKIIELVKTFSTIIYILCLLSIAFIFLVPQYSLAQYNGQIEYFLSIPRPQSFLGNQNSYAEFMLWGIFSIFMLLQFSLRKKILIVSLAIFLLLIILAGSRAVILSLLLFFFLLLNHKRKIWLFAISASLASVIFLFQEQSVTYARIGNSGDMNRFNYIRWTFYGALERPLLGYGPGNNNLAMRKGMEKEGLTKKGKLQSPHNKYLRTLAEVGFLGLGVWLIVVLQTFWRARKVFKINPDPLLNILTAFFVATLFHRLFVHGLPGAISHDNLFPLILMAFVAGYSQTSATQKEKSCIGPIINKEKKSLVELSN